MARSAINLSPLDYPSSYTDRHHRCRDHTDSEVSQGFPLPIAMYLMLLRAQF